MTRKKLDTFEFKPFSPKQLRILNWWQNDSPVSDRFMVIADGAIRSGKELPLSAKLPTQNGYILMGDVKVGDKIFDRLGNPTEVLAVYPQGKKDIWEVTFHDGSKCRCGKEHLWSYTTKKCVSNGNKTVFTSTLGEIMDDLDRFKDRKTMHERAGKYVFPLNGCVQYNKQEVKLDPYLLGLLLGDGCFSLKNSGIAFINDEDYLHNYIKNILPNYDMYYKYTPRNDNHCACGNLSGNKRGVKSKLRVILEIYNLYGCKSESKFIPKEYKYNTKEVRLHILAGLLNTDGSVGAVGKPSIHYCSVSKQMCDDVAEVARSLGMFVNTDRKVDTREKNIHDCYSLCIRVNDDLYKLLSPKHKARLNMNVKKQKNWRLIKSIKYVGKEEAQCIYVDNKEHLYLTDDFIVTHNTVSMALSFLLFVMNTFNHMDAAIAGKTVGTLRRNVISPLKKMASTVGYDVIDHRADNYLEVKNGDVVNYIYLFGGKDEASQDTVQGSTFCAVMLDEIVLMPESFYNQISGRLSVEGAKMFLNCNPGSPYHWFKRSIIDKAQEKDALYIHFNMDDNLTLPDSVKDRYKKQYSGVWAKRFIEGLWTASSGIIYDMFDDDRNKIEPDDIPYDDAVKYCVSIDYGTANATVFLLMMEDSRGFIYICKEYYFCGRLEAEENNNYDTQKTDLEFSEDAKTFIGENYNCTGLTYTEIPFIVDPAANSFKLQLRRRRFRTKNANNEVIDGIRNVASLLGQGKLKISTECENTLNEIHTYSWDRKAQENSGTDRPLKVDDHCLVGDTLVDTTDGMKRIDSLVGKEGYVNTINPYTGEHCVKKFYNVRKTREHAEVITIVLESGDKLKLTPEHLVLTDRGWVEALNLLPDADMIVSLNKKIGIVDKECCIICYDVYNMEVEDVHCFAVTNSKIIVHNCMDAMRYGSQYLNEKHSIADVGRNIGLQ